MATCPACQGDYDAGLFCPRDGSRLVGGATAPVLGGRYRLLRKVGEGGMGEVYEAEHVFIRRRVAVKILRREMASEPEAVERLQREAQSTSGLAHPNIVDCIDFGYSDERQVYLVMEWLEGENLDERLKRGAVDVPTALDVAAQAASGLVEAHQRGVVHRDLKPANLFLTRDRKGALVVKVLDFGIAKLAIHQTKLTGTGVLVGTPSYMAPEQAFGDTVDGRTDVYALGVILYEMVTGAVPFQADSALGVLHQQTSRMPVPPSARTPERAISTAVDALVMRCLAKRPEDRYASMQDVLTALDAIRGSGAAPALLSPAARDASGSDDQLGAASVPSTARGALVIAAAVVVAGGVIALVLALRGGHRTRPASLDAGAVAGRPSDGGIDLPPLTVDAAAAAVPVDAVAAGPDGGGPPGWTVDGRGRGKRFAFTASAPTELHADRPNRVTFTLRELGAPLAQALRHGDLRASLEIAYFKDDHALVHRSTGLVDPSLTFTTELAVERSGRHHFHLRLLDGQRVVDEARFDVVIQ